MATNFEEIGKKFVEHYYTLFDSNKRADLGGLYQNESMLTFEGEKFQGRDNVVKKLTSLTFQTVKHAITTIDCQPTPNSGVVVFVCGNLAVDGNTETPLKFAQTFQLFPVPNQPGAFFVFNDMFRLNYC